MDLGSDRPVVLCQFAFDGIFQAGLRVYECRNGLLEGRIALTVDAKTVEGGLQISFDLEAPLFKVHFYSLIDQAIHRAAQNLAEVCKSSLLGLIEPQGGRFPRRGVSLFEHGDTIALPLSDVNFAKWYHQLLRSTVVFWRIHASIRDMRTVPSDRLTMCRTSLAGEGQKAYRATQSGTRPGLRIMKGIKYGYVFLTGVRVEKNVSPCLPLLAVVERRRPESQDWGKMARRA